MFFCDFVNCKNFFTAYNFDNKIHIVVPSKQSNLKIVTAYFVWVDWHKKTQQKVICAFSLFLPLAPYISSDQYSLSELVVELFSACYVFFSFFPFFKIHLLEEARHFSFFSTILELCNWKEVA